MAENTNSKSNKNKNSGSSHAYKGAKTRTYKHVEIEHKRPKLSKEPTSGAKKGYNKKRYYQKNVEKDKKSSLRVIPLGGLDAIGKNMTAFECNGDILLDDAGLMFPEDDHPGIDLILPDYTYILENTDKLKGIVITHGHEDHTGALPYLMKDLGKTVPIYASKLTIGLIKCKFKEHRINNVKFVEVTSGMHQKIGNFEVDFFAVNHSIPGALGLFIQTPAGNVMHTGDFKLDQTPIDGVHTDFGSICKFASKGVDLLMSDSTNAMSPGFTKSEAEVGKALKEIIASSSGRVIIASFASHVHRLQQICDAAVECGRKVVVTGRSMVQITDIARNLGYLSVKDSNIIDAYELDKVPSEKVVVMCTGSQGEPLSALSRIANGEHKTIQIESGDTVIISATPVPGNEKAVTKVINMLSKLGVNVYDKSRGCVHVSGHGSAEELKLMLTMVEPDAFMPVHGEACHLRAHAELAKQVGIAEDKIFILDNGDSLTLNYKGIKRGEGVESGIVYVDGLSVGDTSQDVLDERQELGNQGIASVAIALSAKNNKLLGKPIVEMHGIPGGDSKGLVNDMQMLLASTLNKNFAGKEISAHSVKRLIRDTASNILWEKTKQKPMIVVNVLKV